MLHVYFNLKFCFPSMLGLELECAIFNRVTFHISFKMEKKTSYSNEWLLKFVKWLSISYSKQSPNNILCWLRLIVQIFIHVFIYFRQAQELANRNSTQVENLAVSIVMIQVLKKMI